MTFAERSDVPSAIERVFRAEYGKVIATLIGALRDFDLAEEALQDAFTTALERWPRDGIPPNPAAWLATTAKRKAIDTWRRGFAPGQCSAHLGGVIPSQP